MPGTLRNVCMSASLSGFQAGSVSSSADRSTMSWCVLGSSLYWWSRLCAWGDFWWAVPGLCVEGGKAALLVGFFFVCLFLFFSPWMRILKLSPLKWLYIGCLSMTCAGVVFMAPSMTSRAMFWTLSSLFLLVLAAVPHAVDAYSIVGYTVSAWTLVRIDESAPLVVLQAFSSRLVSADCFSPSSLSVASR